MCHTECSLVEVVGQVTGSQRRDTGLAYPQHPGDRRHAASVRPEPGLSSPYISNATTHGRRAYHKKHNPDTLWYFRKAWFLPSLPGFQGTTTHTPNRRRERYDPTIGAPYVKAGPPGNADLAAMLPKSRPRRSTGSLNDSPTNRARSAQ